MATTVGSSARSNNTTTVKRNYYTLHILQTAKSWSTKHIQQIGHTIQARLHKVGHLNITRFIYCQKLKDHGAQDIHDRRPTRFNRNHMNNNAPSVTHFDPLPDGLKTAFPHLCCASSDCSCSLRVSTDAVCRGARKVSETSRRLTGSQTCLISNRCTRALPRLPPPRCVMPRPFPGMCTQYCPYRRYSRTPET